MDKEILSDTRRRRALPLAITVLVAVNLGVFLAIKRSDKAPTFGLNSQGENASRNQRTSILSEPLEKLIEQLQVEETYLSTGYQSERIGEQEDLDRVLSNPRTTQLIELLKATPDSAYMRAKSICTKMRERHSQAITRWLLSEEDTNAPKTNEPLNGTKLGVGAAIFALAHFSQPSDVIEEFEKLDNSVQQSLDRMAARPNVFSEPLRTLTRNVCRLDNSFKVSILCFCARRTDDQMQPVKRTLDKALEGVGRSSVPLTKLDAKVTAYERSSGIAIDPNDVIESVVVYRWGKHLFDQRYQEAVLRSVIQIVDIKR